jgi:hypothetical protein
VSEELRKGAFYSDVLDMKTAQPILFGMLRAEHNTVARRPMPRRRARPARAGRNCTR